MIESKAGRSWSTGAAFALFGLFGLATSSPAGTGRLLSQWMTRAPAIDGQISAAEWDEAKLVDLGAGVTIRLGNDRRTLYLAVLDSADPVHTSNDSVTLLFDDEGGTPPILDDGAFGSLVCHPTPDSGEGRIDLTHSQNVLFQELPQAGFCVEQNISNLVSFHSALRQEGLTYEAAIPLDGPSPMQGDPGERFGVLFRLWRDGAAVACLPDCLVSQPADFRNLILASGGCNTGPQDFGSGDPLVGLPLDWTSLLTIGSGESWQQSPPAQFGDPVFCDANDTGGAGGAACVANFFYTTPRTDAQLRMPLALAGQTSASVRVRALLTLDPNGHGPFEYLDIGVKRQVGGDTLLFWLGQEQAAYVSLPFGVAGSPPIELWFTHSTFSGGGIEGGYAQIDDVELLCGPILFRDGFESGLTTHWSAEAP